MRRLLRRRSSLAQVCTLQVLDDSFSDLSNESWIERVWWLRLAERLVNGIPDRLRLWLVEDGLINGASARP